MVWCVKLESKKLEVQLKNEQFRVCIAVYLVRWASLWMSENAYWLLTRDE